MTYINKSYYELCFTLKLQVRLKDSWFHMYAGAVWFIKWAVLHIHRRTELHTKAKYFTSTIGSVDMFMSGSNDTFTTGSNCISTDKLCEQLHIHTHVYGSYLVGIDLFVKFEEKIYIIIPRSHCIPGNVHAYFLLKHTGQKLTVSPVVFNHWIPQYTCHSKTVMLVPSVEFFIQI